MTWDPLGDPRAMQALAKAASDPKLTRGACLVLRAIIMLFSEDYGDTCVGYGYLSKISGVSFDTTRRSVRVLRRGGYIRRLRKGGSGSGDRRRKSLYGVI